jgi:TPR repeat protein
MGANQSRGGGAARVSEVKSMPIPKHDIGAEHRDPNLPEGKVLDTPIFMDNQSETASKYPTPTGHEYDLMDKIAAELPSVIDDQSKQQVEDYKQACDEGKGPMVACFATAEFISLFEQKHKEAFELYKNTCFRPKSDKSPNGVLVDGTKAYPAGCFNLAQMLMTGKGGVPFDRAEAYKSFDRACRGGHGGACHLQAKLLLSEPGALGKGIPYNPKKAAQLLQGVCDEGDPFSCFLLATMLLRGDRVTPETDNVTPQEARGASKIQDRPNEVHRSKAKEDHRVALKRDPPRAEKLLQQACVVSGHAPSCYNLAVMYTQGDDGVPKNEGKAKEFQNKTEEMVNNFGGFGM